MNIRITKMIGGGTSWFYLMVDGKCHGSSHQDNSEGMQVLYDKKEALKTNKES